MIVASFGLRCFQLQAALQRRSCFKTTAFGIAEEHISSALVEVRLCTYLVI